MQTSSRREILWQKALNVSDNALRCSSLSPLSSSLDRIVRYQQSNFEIRSLTSAMPKHLNKYGPKDNPFAPWDKALEISPINSSHTLILNKYPISKGHMLLITNEWNPQNGWLEMADFDALSVVDRDTSGLWFFNSDTAAGASQPHRHLQLLRRSLGESPCPRSIWFCNSLGHINYKKLTTSSFNIESRKNRSGLYYDKELYTLYLSLCASLGLGNPNEDIKPKHPYNLLISNNWMAIFSRSREEYKGFSVNALGFAGYLLATSESDINWLDKEGPLALLNAVI